MYSEKVTSMRVLLASIWTSAVPAGHPDPKSETPSTLTVEGGVARGATRARWFRVDGTPAARAATERRDRNFILMQEVACLIPKVGR